MTTQYVYVVENGDLEKLEVIKETSKGYRVKAPHPRTGFYEKQVLKERYYSTRGIAARCAVQRTFTDSLKARCELIEQLAAQREYLENHYKKAFDKLEKQEESLREFEG